MILEPLHCPSCDHNDVIKHGRTAAGKQRYRCQNRECKQTFIRDSSYNAYLPHLKEQISDMAMNGSGMRDTARVLKVSPNIVIETLKKAPSLHSVNEAVLRGLEPTQTIVRLCLAEDIPFDAEVDECGALLNPKHSRDGYGGPSTTKRARC